MRLLFAVFGLAAGAIAADGVPEAPFRDCDGCPEMLVVPGGNFVMGAHGGEEGRPEGPPREMRVERDFALGRYEVTNAQFEAFVSATGYQVEKGCRGKFDGEWENHPESNWTDLMLGQEQRPDHPVTCVSWLDARAYVEWLAEMSGRPYRLPTEAEWEYAARAGAVGSFTWGADPEVGMRLCQCV